MVAAGCWRASAKVLSIDALVQLTANATTSSACHGTLCGTAATMRAMNLHATTASLPPLSTSALASTGTTPTQHDMAIPKPR